MSEMNVAEKFGMRVQHAGIHCKNYQRTFEFYRDLFGFEEVEGDYSFFEGGVFPKMRFIKQKGTDFWLELYEVQDAEPYSLVDFEWTHGLKHLNFAVKDIDALNEWKKMVYERGDVVVVVDNDYTETSACMYIEDPDGILVEVTTNSMV